MRIHSNHPCAILVHFSVHFTLSQTALSKFWHQWGFYFHWDILHLHIIEENPPCLLRSYCGYSAHTQCDNQISMNPEWPPIPRLVSKAVWTKQHMFPEGDSKQTLAGGLGRVLGAWQMPQNWGQSPGRILGIPLSWLVNENFKRGE